MDIPTVVLRGIERDDPDPNGTHVDWMRVEGPMLGLENPIPHEDIGDLIAKAAVLGFPVTLQPVE